MPNNYYERLSEMNPGELADGLAIEQEFDAISRGFAKLPVPHRDGNGFEGPTRVGDPAEKTDAVNLGALEKLNLPIYRKKITTEDWNSIVEAGIYDVANATGLNKPPGYPYGILIVYKFNGVVLQQYSPDKSSQGTEFFRSCENISESTWGVWDGSLAISKIVGAVSKANGSPSGAIIESGANANGEYIKFADGTMICRVSVEMPGMAPLNTDVIGIKLWPHPFLSPPLVVFSAENQLGAGSLSNIGLHYMNGVVSTGTTQTTARLSSYTYRQAIGADKVLFRVVGFGVW